MANVPSDLRYTVSHEWVRLEGDIAKVGITDYAQSELGDVIFVDLPNVGRVLQKDEVFGSLESVKTVSDLYAPLAGEVIEVNTVLQISSETVNEDPYGDGYLLTLRVSDPGQFETLLDGPAYSATIA
jgi:glycine cleavage system H protein